MSQETEGNGPREDVEPELPDQIPSDKEPTDPVLEKAFRKEPRHTEEEPEERES